MVKCLLRFSHCCQSTQGPRTSMFSCSAALVAVSAFLASVYFLAINRLILVLPVSLSRLAGIPFDDGLAEGKD